MPYSIDPYGVDPYGDGEGPATTPVPTPAAPSGTTTFNMDLGEIIQEAYERLGILMLSGLDYRMARRSIDIMMQEWANRGLNLWTVEEGTQVLTASDGSYDLPSDCIDVIDAVLRTGTGTSQQDVSMTRISVSTYATLPNKNVTGRPVEYYVDRQRTPTITVWPIPDATQTYTLVYWQLRRIQDTGQPASNIMDMPTRFIPALCAGLAYYLAMKKPSAMNRAEALKMVYEEQWTLAAGEDRSRASFRFVPYIPQRL
jgi:hypothetical protein